MAAAFLKLLLLHNVLYFASSTSTYYSENIVNKYVFIVTEVGLLQSSRDFNNNNTKELRYAFIFSFVFYPYTYLSNIIFLGVGRF